MRAENSKAEPSGASCSWILAVVASLEFALHARLYPCIIAHGLIHRFGQALFPPAPLRERHLALAERRRSQRGKQMAETMDKPIAHDQRLPDLIRISCRPPYRGVWDPLSLEADEINA